MRSPTFRPLKREAPLPYKVLAGVEPCRQGWLVVSAKLQNVSMLPQAPEVMGSFAEILDARPGFTVVAVHLPIGLPDVATPGGRRCDRLARLLDACAGLWTARRLAARSVSRLPESPEWDEQGVRMELVR